MLTKLTIKNFRQIGEQTLNLAASVVLIGPNNGGKTSVLQAVSLLAMAIKVWGEKRMGKASKAARRAGVAINLAELSNIPIAEYRELWPDLTLRAPGNQNIKIALHAEGVTQGQTWRTGFEFDYNRDTLIYARLTEDHNAQPYHFPKILLNERIGFLPSVAALTPIEDRLERGSILRYIGEGKTADVLRNVCYYLYTNNPSGWDACVAEIDRLFRVRINPPRYFPHSGLLTMTYTEDGKKAMELSSVGSGTKQAILLFAFIGAFPNTVNLLDEPKDKVIRVSG